MSQYNSCVQLQLLCLLEPSDMLIHCGLGTLVMPNELIHSVSSAGVLVCMLSTACTVS